MTLFRTTSPVTASRSMHAPTLQTLPDAVAANVRRVRARTDARIMAVVKADGYGHGAVTVARAAVTAGAEWLGVTDVAEGSVLRAAGLTVPILSWLNPSGVDAARRPPTASTSRSGSVDELRQLIAGCRPLGDRRRARAPAHRHRNVPRRRARARSGRTAVAPGARRARAAAAIEVVAVMGHLPLADEADPGTTLRRCCGCGRPSRRRCAPGSGRAARAPRRDLRRADRPATHFDLVRIGAGLVGIDPSETVALQRRIAADGAGRAQPPWRRGGHAGRLRRHARDRPRRPT